MENGFNPLLAGKGRIASRATTQRLAARLAFFFRSRRVAHPLTSDVFRSRFKTLGAPSLRFLQGRVGCCRYHGIYHAWRVAHLCGFCKGGGGWPSFAFSSKLTPSSMRPPPRPWVPCEHPGIRKPGGGWPSLSHPISFVPVQECGGGWPTFKYLHHSR
jgi:hypothetical protein